MSTKQYSEDNSDDTLESKETDAKKSNSDQQKNNEDIETRLSPPSATAIHSPIPEEPQFLRLLK